MKTASYIQNPYVGPRPFQTGETLYGRDREVTELLDLLIAERVVLLYSPSGAGKTSLIQAGLLPELIEEGFQALPVIRVSLEPPPEQKAELPANYNRYVLSVLLSLEEGLPEDRQLPLTGLAGLTLTGYVNRAPAPNAQASGSKIKDAQTCPETGEAPSDAQRASAPDAQASGSRGKDAEASSNAQPASTGFSFQPAGLAPGRIVLIFDQFEEILTVDPADRDAKADFFAQVGETLRHPDHYALFAMREEFLAKLDPYLRHVPTRLSTTFRLDLLGTVGAHQAVQEPVRQAGIPFLKTAAAKLIDDLRRVRVQQPDGSTEERLGLYVEPVQLQVVCYRLWEHLPENTPKIQEAHIQEAGDVNTALAGYYADRVAATAQTTGIRERTIREWFDTHLITEQGIRGQVLRGAEQSQGLDNQAIAPLVDAHLVRAENRRGATWYELTHDRLIEPVRHNNAAWFQANMPPG